MNKQIQPDKKSFAFVLFLPENTKGLGLGKRLQIETSKLFSYKIRTDKNLIDKRKYEFSTAFVCLFRGYFMV